jgi:5-methylcytosine-specific restriction endonuclease McrA
MNNDIRDFVIRVLRRGTYKWPARTIALREARLERGVYECAHCKNQFGRKEVHVDHKIPVIPLHGTNDFNLIIERMFCPASGLQVLCKPCHKQKTKIENDLRKGYRKR